MRTRVFIALILIGTLLLSGCDVLDKKEAGTSGAGISTGSAQTSAESSVSSEPPVATQTAQAPATPETSDTEPADTPLTPTRGSWDSNNRYGNDFASIYFTLPADWVYATDEEIASLMNLSLDIMADAGMVFSEEMLRLQNVYDMAASNVLTGSNVQVMYENLSAVIGSGMLTEEQYLKIVQQKMSAVLNYEFAEEMPQYYLCGELYTIMMASVAEYGLEQYIFVRKLDTYMISIVVSVMSGDDVDEIISCFI